MNHSDKKEITNQLYDWLTLSLTPSFGIKTCLEIWQKYPDLKEFFADYPNLKMNEKARNWLANPDQKLIEKQIEWSQSDDNHHLIAIDDPLYPKKLKNIANPPILLYIKGNLLATHKSQIAIVGSRNPSSQGAKISQHFAKNLALAGFAITSGLAIGIDSGAHQGAVEAKAQTIAVLGTGINQIYPKSNQKLAEQILHYEGCLVSEFHLDAQANNFHFPQRNRIISGLSLATIVIQATENSGSLITSQIAIDQGKEVFALPGSIYDPLAKGCNKLIDQGARIITSLESLIEQLKEQFGISHLNRQKELKIEDVNNELINHPLLDFIDYHPKSIDEIVFESKMPIFKVQADLTELELGGLILFLPDGQIVKKQKF